MIIARTIIFSPPLKGILFIAAVFLIITQSQKADSKPYSQFDETNAPATSKRIPSELDYLPLFSTDFSSNRLDGLVFHANPGSVTLVKNPGNFQAKVVKISLNKTDDFSRVCNGSPRAEISFQSNFNFRRNREYLVEFSTYIPSQFKFDFKQPEIIAQIHQKLNTGSPVFALVLDGDKYQARVRSDKVDTQNVTIAQAGSDKDKWVSWMLRYRPDSSGVSSISELYKNDELSFSANGHPNSYPTDDGAYFKFGLYKWWWNAKPSDVTNRRLYFGDLTVKFKRSN